MNLLPRYQKRKIQKEIAMRLFSVFGGILVFWAFIFLALMYNTILFLNFQIPVIDGRLEVERKSQKLNTIKGIEEEIEELNETLAKIEKIRQKDSYNLPYILRLVGAVVPEGAELRSITFNNGNMSISGHANERSHVLAMKESLENEKFFKNVNSPLSNIVKERDINFGFSFFINGQ